MRKIGISIMVMVAVLFAASVSHAGYMWVEGTVQSTTGTKVAGAAVVWNMAGEDVIRFTDANGYYGFLWHNWCDDKLVVVTKQGYYTTRRRVMDGSCCSCVPECPPENGEIGCRGYFQVNFTLTPIVQDLDNDGYIDANDNCVYVPNGSALGTCTSGKTGQTCYGDGGCGCGAIMPNPCQQNQEDADQDGKGDVCDSTPLSMASFEEVHASIVDSKKAPFFYLACMQDAKFYEQNAYACNPKGATTIASSDLMQAQSLSLNPWLYNLLGLFSLTFCQANICEYECLAQFVADIANGPEFAFGHPTYPDSPRPLPECPDVPNFADFVNNWLDMMWEIIYGDNFPPEG